MGDRFSVDTGELGQFMRTLKEAHASLDEVRKQMKDTTSGGIGTKELDEACDSFQEHWGYGSEQMTEQAKKLAEAVGRTKANYDEVENALRDAFRQAGSQGGGK